MAKSSHLIGPIAVLALAAGGGFLLGPLGSSGRLEAAMTPPPPFHTPMRVLIEEVSGDVEVLAPGGMWRRVVAGETLERPTAMRTHGPDSLITVSYDTVRVSAQHDARVLLGGAGALSVQLDSGRILVHSRSGQVSVAAPLHQAKVAGEAFGVWSRGDVLVAAVLDGSLELDAANGISTQYTKGREIILLPKGPTPVVMVPELRLEVQNVERAGKGYRITGQTHPSAVVLAKDGARYQSISVSSSGTFVAELDTAAPKTGELVAHDAAGRRAEQNMPSMSLDQVLASISKGAPIANAQATAKPEPPMQEQPQQPAERAREEVKAPVVQQPVRQPEEKPAKTVAAVKAEPKEKKKKAKAPDTGRAAGHGEPTAVGIDLPALPGEPADEKKAEAAAPAEKKEEPKAEKKEKKEGDEEAVELEWE